MYVCIFSLVLLWSRRASGEEYLVECHMGGVLLRRSMISAAVVVVGSRYSFNRIPRTKYGGAATFDI